MKGPKPDTDWDNIHWLDYWRHVPYMVEEARRIATLRVAVKRAKAALAAPIDAVVNRIERAIEKLLDRDTPKSM